MSRLQYARKGTTLALVGALIATPLLAQQQDRPSSACVREIVQLCGMDRAKIRPCLRERFDELSDDCSAELRSRMEQRQQREAQRRASEEAAAETKQDER